MTPPPLPPRSREGTSLPPQVTVIVVPRERFSVTQRSLESLYRDTGFPFQLIYVDGGSPPGIARYLAAESKAREFELVRTDRLLAPNEARNLGLARATGRYMAFIDNDVLLAPGWLAALVACAEETGADLVGPLYGVGEPDGGFIHMAGGTTRIEERGGERYLLEQHRFAGRRIAEVEKELRREPTELLEFHCLLARASTLRAMGPLDERLLSTGENIDLCLAVRQQGGAIYFEPSARMSYLPPPPLDPFDLAYFRLRWSEAWTRASYTRLRQKWKLSPHDPYFPEHFRWLRSHRRLVLQPIQKGLQRALGRGLARWPLRGLALCEMALNRWLIRDLERVPRP
jgi:GT2 family glycosyltransferase